MYVSIRARVPSVEPESTMTISRQKSRLSMQSPSTAISFLQMMKAEIGLSNRLIEGPSRGIVDGNQSFVLDLADGQRRTHRVDVRGRGQFLDDEALERPEVACHAMQQEI